jgi:hypothetical protein
MILMEPWLRPRARVQICEKHQTTPPRIRSPNVCKRGAGHQATVRVQRRGLRLRLRGAAYLANMWHKTHMPNTNARFCGLAQLTISDEQLSLESRDGCAVVFFPTFTPPSPTYPPFHLSPNDIPTACTITEDPDPCDAAPPPRTSHHRSPTTPAAIVRDALAAQIKVRATSMC